MGKSLGGEDDGIGGGGRVGAMSAATCKDALNCRMKSSDGKIQWLPHRIKRLLKLCPPVQDNRCHRHHGALGMTITYTVVSGTTQN